MTKTILAASMLLMAVSTIAQAAPTIADQRYWPNQSLVQRDASSIFDARASIPERNTSAAKVRNQAGPKEVGGSAGGHKIEEITTD